MSPAPDHTPATRAELMARLDSLGLQTTVSEHPPLFTVEQSQALRGDIAGGHTKNLFLKDKKGQLWLVVALEDAQIDLKRLHERIGSARLSFARAELMREHLGVEPGSVTPFGLINDRNQAVKVVLDAAMMAEPLLNYHPLSNDATVTISAEDLLAFIRACGHRPAIVALG